MGKKGKFRTIRQFKRGGESRVPQLNSNNRFHVLTKMKVGTSDSKETKKKEVEVRKTKKDELLRKITVKIGLERIDTQEGVTVEELLNNRAMGLVMSSEFVRKQEFQLKKIDRPIYVRNIDSSFNQERSIKHTVEVNIYYQGYRKRIEINRRIEMKCNLGNTMVSSPQFQD